MKNNRLFLLALLSSSLLYSEVINVEKASLRTSFESVEISPTEEMGLLGLNYLLEPNDNFYYGLGLYGAMSGERGGFFVGGLTAGLKYEVLENIYLDAGLFAGGGGGASAGQGGGLMLKSYLGGLYQFDNYSLGLNYSYITFPNGEIDSSQFSLVADMSFETICVEDNIDFSLFKNYNFSQNRDYIVATYQAYKPKEGVKTRSQTRLQDDVMLVGIEYGSYVSENFIAYFESAGAMKGATGYMEVLGGVAYSAKIIDSVNAQAKLSFGGAGGGEVDTGGGAVTKASLNLNILPTKALNIGLGAGYYYSLDGTFEATFAKLDLGINTNFLSLSDTKSDFDYSSISSQKFNIRVTNQTYIYSDTLSTNPTHTDNVQLIGIQLDWFLTDGLYMSGQAFGAYKGEAGGYVSGMFGAGYIQPLFFDISGVAELSIGAGGGGSINSGGGNILQPMAGLMYDINREVSLELLLGKLISLNGELETNIANLSFVYKFNKLVLK
ncbi:MAG: hypothetical protein DRG78_09675 [Epsilonproteobacteria bacterium]|nr:MAG: hypothetical protein DRG78_09675 [Campylobacterota bacterium]